MHLPVVLSIVALALSPCIAKPTSLSGVLSERDSVSDCNGGTYSGSYTDGQGTYAYSDTITHPYKFPAVRKCWHDYFVVDAKAAYDFALKPIQYSCADILVRFAPWEQASGDVYCTGTQTCSASFLNGTQTCQTRSESLSVSAGAAIQGITLGLSATFELSNQQCYSSSDTTACTWNDAACHVVWTQQELVNSVGYWRKRCNWGNGDETDCMSDWAMSTPTTKTNFGCGSKCGDTNPCGHTDGMPC